jgi:hypothetical protein
MPKSPVEVKAVYEYVSGGDVVCTIMDDVGKVASASGFDARRAARRASKRACAALGCDEVVITKSDFLNGPEES